MKLFLASKAKLPKTLKDIESFVGGFTGKKIAYIPTAENGEHAYGSWKTESDAWKVVSALDAHIEPVVLEEYKDASVIDVLKTKDILWFAGGVPGYLLYWVRRCQLDLHIKELLNQGIVFVGSSAGGMICSPSIKMTELLDEEHGGGLIPGLGLVDFEFWPHYEESQLEKIKNFYTGNKLYLLKDGEAITVVDGVVTVLGEERIVTK